MQEMLLLFLIERIEIKMKEAICTKREHNRYNGVVLLPGATVFVYLENWRSKANFFFIIAAFVYITSGYLVAPTFMQSIA
jgi:hypothetical protein